MTSLEPAGKSRKSQRWAWIASGCIVVAVGCVAVLAAAVNFGAPLAQSSFATLGVGSQQTMAAVYGPMWTTTAQAIVAQQRAATAVQFGTATVQAAEVHATEVAAWEVVFNDGFATSGGGWLEGIDESEYATGEYNFVDGVYRWDVTAKRGVTSYVLPVADIYSDIFLSAKVRLVSGPEDSSAGLIFRLQQDNYYFFEVSDTGQFSAWLLDDADWIPLIDWTESEAIRQPGEVNELAVSAVGGHFTFYINGQYMGEAADHHLSRGRVGLALSLPRAGDHVVYEFDDFVLRTSDVTATSATGDLETTQTPMAGGAGVLQLARAWPIVFSEDFGQAPEGWAASQLALNASESQGEVVQGAYRWEADSDIGTFWRVGPEYGAVGDFYLGADVTLIEAPPDSTYGLTFRRTERNTHYYFGLNELGASAFQILDNGNWRRLNFWSGQSAFERGVAYQLAVVSQGGQFSFFINDLLIGRAWSEELAHGTVGVGMGMPGGAAMVVKIDNFELRAPQVVWPPATPTEGPSATP